jgi:16S rRNA (guanine527-N7)-methyltransferase
MKKDEGWPCEKWLKEGLKRLGVFDTITVRGLENYRAAFLSLEQKYQKYIEEIELFNEAYGLVKVIDRRELIIKHILDSLSPLKIITRLLGESSRIGSVPWQIADVGSGAGLPGIPLAICLPKAEFTLIEPKRKRAGFLQNCVAVLDIGNVRVKEIEMEKAAPGRFDTVVFRAFRPLEPPILRGLLRLLKPGGFLAAWKGRLENSREEMTAV